MMENSYLKEIIDAARPEEVTIFWLKQQLAQVKTRLLIENANYQRLKGRY